MSTPPLTPEQKDVILATHGINLRWTLGDPNEPYTADIRTDEFDIEIREDVIIRWNRITTATYDYTTLFT
jgi:hypothetical protein